MLLTGRERRYEGHDLNPLNWFLDPRQLRPQAQGNLMRIRQDIIRFKQQLRQARRDPTHVTKMSSAFFLVPTILTGCKHSLSFFRVLSNTHTLCTVVFFSLKLTSMNLLFFTQAISGSCRFCFDRDHPSCAREKHCIAGALLYCAILDNCSVSVTKCSTNCIRCSVF